MQLFYNENNRFLVKATFVCPLQVKLRNLSALYLKRRFDLALTILRKAHFAGTSYRKASIYVTQPKGMLNSNIKQDSLNRLL